MFAARMPASLMGEIEAWADEHDTTRSEALRRLVELGLAKTRPMAKTNRKAAAKASKMAAQEIDRLVDQAAPVEEQESRKRRLLKGPKEFRDLRRDHPRLKARPK